MESMVEVCGVRCVSEAWLNGNFYFDVHVAVMTSGIPLLVDDGRADKGELLRGDSVRELFPLDAPLELGKGSGGCEITGQGFGHGPALDRSGDLKEGGFCKRGSGQWDGCSVGMGE